MASSYEQLREPLEEIGGEVVDGCVVLGVVGRQADAPPSRVSVEEILRLAAVDLRIVGAATDEDDGAWRGISRPRNLGTLSRLSP